MNKTLFIALTISLSLSQAFAGSDIEQAYLTSVKLDKKLKAKAKNLNVGGNVSVNHAEKTASFTVHGAPKCKPGKPCPKFIKYITGATDLPIVSETKDACHTRKIVAKQDNRPVDGNLEVLTIYDARFNICWGGVKPPGTSIVFEVTTGGLNPEHKFYHYKTTASAGPLEAVDP